MGGAFLFIIGGKMIKIKNVSKNFITDKKNFHALKNVSLTINDGEIYGIVGYSGAGKSTLVRLINKLENATSGSVIIDGENITKATGKKLQNMRHQIGMIFQSFNLLWSRNVLENIMLPLEITNYPKNKRLSKAKELIELVGLSDKQNAYPANLSGGQKQRVAIARALATNPKILLSDEATSALDPETTDAILELLKTINKKYGLTIVMISHQMEVIEKICHRVALMADGEVIEEGRIDEIFKQPKNPITKQFINNFKHSNNLKETEMMLKKAYPKGQLIHITYIGNITNTPLLYQMCNQYQIPLNIISADITQSQSGPIGNMYMYIDDDKDIDAFIKSLINSGVNAEVI